MIIAALEGMPEMKQARASLRNLASGHARRPPDATILDAIEGALQRQDDELETACAELKAKVDGSDADRHAREDAQAQAEAHVTELKQLIAEKKGILAKCAEAIEEARTLVSSSRQAYKTGASELRAAEKTRATLEVAKKEFEPLKDAAAEGVEGAKQVRLVRKVGKEFGFHEEMLAVLPKILTKQVDKRRTFDNLTIKQLEAEMNRHIGAADSELQESETSVSQHEEAVKAAQEALAQAKRTQGESTRALAQAEKALEAGKEAVDSARRHARGFQADARRTAKEFSQAEARVSDFRSGPLAAFELLRGELLGAPTLPASHPSLADTVMT